MNKLLTTIVLAGALAGNVIGGGPLCEATARARENKALTLRVTPERDALYSRGPRELVLQVELEGKRSDAQQRSPMNLAVVLDRSGSMSGAKLEKARQAAAALVDQLEPGDFFSLVIYDNRAEVLVRPERLSTRDDRERVKRMIFAVEPGGGTALHAGVQLGAEQVARVLERERVNRVILLSDGLANVGPSQPRDLAEFGRKLRRDGMSVTTMGLGDDYNEDLMTALAEASHANYYYVKDAEKLPGIFAEELGSARSVLARTVTIRIEVPEGVRLREILGYPEVRCEGRHAEITMPEYFSADRRKFLVRCTVDEAAPVAGKIADVALSYEDALHKVSLTETQSATYQLTEDEQKGIASIRPEVAREVAVLKNRLDKEAAVQLADAGKAKEAAALLRDRATQNAAAPAQQQLPGVAEENKKLEAAAAELESRGQLGKGSRKQVQFENYQDKYQKRPLSSR